MIAPPSSSSSPSSFSCSKYRVTLLLSPVRRGDHHHHHHHHRCLIGLLLLAGYRFVLLMPPLPLLLLCVRVQCMCMCVSICVCVFHTFITVDYIACRVLGERRSLFPVPLKGRMSVFERKKRKEEPSGCTVTCQVIRAAVTLKSVKFKINRMKVKGITVQS